MPTQTFFNLPDDKRKKIVKAAKQEFSKVPLEQASIASIIKTAEIPRGSFYQYFYDKEDLFVYMIGHITNRMIEKAFNFLQESDGDITDAFTKLFFYLIDAIGQGENAHFLKNVFLNMNDKIRGRLEADFKDSHMDSLLRFTGSVNSSILRVQNDQELIYVLKMLKNILFHNIGFYFSKKESQKEAIDTFMFQIKIIKQGIYKA